MLVAWALARRRFWGRDLLNAIVHLPLILPPVVTGYLLLITFGRKGPAGAFLEQAGSIFHAKVTRRDERPDERQANLPSVVVAGQHEVEHVLPCPIELVGRMRKENPKRGRLVL